MPLTTPLKKVPNNFQFKKQYIHTIFCLKISDSKSSDTHFNTTQDVGQKKERKIKPVKFFVFEKKYKKREIMETMIVIFQE